VSAQASTVSARRRQTPYLQQYYGLSDSDLLEIRRERAIELLLEGFRYNDLMRWHAGELLNKQWYGIYIPAMDTSYDLNGDGINDVCVISGEAGNEPGVTSAYSTTANIRWRTARPDVCSIPWAATSRRSATCAPSPRRR